MGITLAGLPKDMPSIKRLEAIVRCNIRHAPGKCRRGYQGDWRKRRGDSWRMAYGIPGIKTGSSLPLELYDQAIATSGTYRRFSGTFSIPRWEDLLKEC